MRESISITTIFQIFILFVLLFTAIMALTINNSNAFGVKDSIVNAIEALDGNYTDGADLNEEIVKVIQETSYRTSGKCPDGYDGFDRAGNRVTSNSSDAAVCISDVDVTGGLDKAFSDFAQNDFVDGKYYKVVLFFQLDIPVFKQIFNFKTVGETRIIYNTIDNLEGVPESSKYKGPEDYDNQGNLDNREPTKGDDSGVNPVRNPGVSSSGGGTTTEDPVEEEEEETPQLTCNTEGLNLDTKLAGVQGVTLGSGQNQGNYGLLFTEPELATQITRMTPGTVFTIQGTASGDDTKWYINYEGQCGWANGANLGIDLGGYAQKIGARVQMNITNNSSSIFKVYGQSISGVTGKKLYNGMTINPLQYNFAKIVGQAALNANAGGDTLVFYETYRPQSISNDIYPYYEKTVMGSTELMNNFSAAGYSLPSGLSNFLAGNSSNHNRACAVDVSLAGKDMPSAMHEISPLASATNSNSNVLRGYFTSAGAKPMGSEWWHFDYGTASTGTCGYYYSSFWDGF